MLIDPCCQKGLIIEEMTKYTKNTLLKLENIFQHLDYKVRYEKGNFQSGYCIVEDRKIAVINKFFDTEGRVHTMLEILTQMDLIDDYLEEDMKKFLNKLIDKPSS